ncbi:MAG TPA: hydrogenase, partial [Bacteroidia bacterium]|nr:hydrogenase [Bacteroidia bacterium]
MSNVESPLRPTLIEGDKTLHDITEDVCRPIESKPNKYWWMVFSVACAALLWWIICVAYTVGTGLGVWGLNKTVGWAWDITNFVWWVGIGHAGTLI